MAEKEPLNGSTIPVKSSEEKQKAMNQSIGLISAIAIMPRLIGAGIAYGLLCIPSVASCLDGKVFSFVVEEKLGFLFLAIYCFNLMATLLNISPMYFKAAIMEGGNLRANQIIYKDVETGKHVLMDELEEIGKYNRANRSLQHFVETSMAVCTLVLLAGSIFPCASFMLCCIFCIGRIVHQIGYTGAYGGHGAGFAIAMLAVSTLEGLVLWVFIKAFSA